MADDTQRRDPGERETAPEAAGGERIPIDRGSPEAHEAHEPASADRFDLGDGQAPPGGASVDGERSRIDGLPDGWLEDPHGGDAAEGMDVLAEMNLHEDAEASGVSHSSRVQIGTGQSGITSASDVMPVASSLPDRSSDGADRDDRFLERADLTAGEEVGETDAGGDHGKPADEWRDIVATVREDAPSESIGFGAFVGGADVADPAIADSFHGDSQGIGESPGESIDVGALGMDQPVVVAAGPIVMSGPRPSATRGGLGQVVGVVLGGVLAIPVTLAILLFVFQRDPLRITPHLPTTVRSFLPARFRPAVVERRPEIDDGGARPLTLDQIPSLPSAEHAPSDEASEAVPSEPAMPAVDGATSLAGDHPTGETAPVPDAGPSDPSTAPGIGEVEIVVVPFPVGSEEGSVGADVRGTGIDLSAVEMAIASAMSATDHLHADAAGGDPAVLEQAQVGWYRSLSLVALELARMERAAIESGRPSSDVLDRFSDLGRRLAVECPEDLEVLGSMWLASGKRPSEGAILVGTLEAIRPVGPWWGGRVSVGGQTPGALSFLAQRAPRAEPGERVMVVGVLGDPGTIWAVDIAPLPVARDAAEDAAEPRSF